MAPKNTEEQIIEQKLQELAGLVEQRDIIQAKIDKTEAAIKAFIDLLEDELDQDIYSARLKVAAKALGLTESIKRIFMEAKRKRKALSPTDVKEQLAESGFPISGYSNPNAVIYTTMMRLRSQGLIEESSKVDGVYTWIAKDEILVPKQQRTEKKDKGVTYRPALAQLIDNEK